MKLDEKFFKPLSAILIAALIFTIYDKFKWAKKAKEASINFHRCSHGTLNAIWKYAPSTTFCKNGKVIQYFRDDELKLEVQKETNETIPCFQK